MAAIADLATLLDLFNSTQTRCGTAGGSSGVASPFDVWAQYGNWGTPSTPVACDASTAALSGSVTGQVFNHPKWDSTLAGQGWLISCESARRKDLSGAILLCDRLSHQGGLVGNLATTQTTNLPTAALPRYTTGVGVHAGLIIQTAIGATGTTFTVSYTNQAGTAGRTSKPSQIGTSVRRGAWIFIPITLADGDTGVRSVESVTLAATTGTAGDIGVVLYKPLFLFPSWTVYEDVTYWDTIKAGKLIEILPDAALMTIAKISAVFNDECHMKIADVA